ncbi:MAG TPA: hypothetical protein VLC50_05305 [Actinomycetes bacterium]|nr:hypothetical protein [Actinomycetes bacterium]
MPFLLFTASPAFAYIRDDGDDPGPGLTVLETIGIYVVAPALLVSLIVALVYLPSMVRGPRYRPGLQWWASPTTFEGSPQAAVAGAEGAAEAVEAGASTSGEGGGASARW